jgi:hypothetical protein
MEATRVRWLIITLIVVVATAMVTYLVVVASPETMEPGIRSTAHEGIDCMRCHSSYEGVDDGLCLDCHPEMPALEWHSGAGGDGDCADCHYEHVGRDYITDLTEVPPHPERDLQLSGVHSPLQCNECHWTASMEAECAFCHERFIEGTHEVGFTSDCELCHIQSIWDVDYDHAHEKAECLDCHGDSPDHTYPGYLEYSTECNVCHEVDLWIIPEFDHEWINATNSSCQLCHPMALDPLYGGRSSDCDDCHLNTSWWPQKVDHFVLEPPCTRCHADDRPTEHLTDREMAPMDCDSCHVAGTSWNRQIQHITHPQPCIQCHGEASDVHEGPYADDCTWCHITDRRDILKPHPDQAVECTLCHLPEHGGGDRERSVDDAHADRCNACHVAGTEWQSNDIDHDALGADCYACHDAPHDPIGGWEAACGVCHLTEYWLPVQADHDRFSDDCLACHWTTHPNGKDRYSDDCTLCHVTDDWAVRYWDHDPSLIQGIECVSCHDDIHRGSLGIVCEDCHTTDTWETEVINP